MGPCAGVASGGIIMRLNDDKGERNFLDDCDAGQGPQARSSSPTDHIN